MLIRTILALFVIALPAGAQSINAPQSQDEHDPERVLGWRYYAPLPGALPSGFYDFTPIEEDKRSPQVLSGIFCGDYRQVISVERRRHVQGKSVTEAVLELKAAWHRDVCVYRRDFVVMPLDRAVRGDQDNTPVFILRVATPDGKFVYVGNYLSKLQSAR